DGCDHEASIPYHRLVTELFICGLAAAEALVPDAVSDEDRERLDRMLQFVRDYTRPDGLAPQVGDADDGRFLPLLDYGRRDPRSHHHLFAQAGRTSRPHHRPRTTRVATGLSALVRSTCSCVAATLVWAGRGAMHITTPSPLSCPWAASRS